MTTFRDAALPASTTAATFGRLRVKFTTKSLAGFLLLLPSLCSLWACDRTPSSAPSPETVEPMQTTVASISAPSNAETETQPDAAVQNPCDDIPGCELFKDGCHVAVRPGECWPNLEWCKPSLTLYDLSENEWRETWLDRLEQLSFPKSTPIAELYETLFKSPKCPSGRFAHESFYLHEFAERSALLLIRSGERWTTLYARPGKTHWELQLLDRFNFGDTGKGGASWDVREVQSKRRMNESSYDYFVYELVRDSGQTVTIDGLSACCEAWETRLQFTLILENDRPVFHALSRLAAGRPEGSIPLEGGAPYRGGLTVQCEAVYGVKGKDELYVTIRQAPEEGPKTGRMVAEKRTVSLAGPYQVAEWCPTR